MRKLRFKITKSFIKERFFPWFPVKIMNEQERTKTLIEKLSLGYLSVWEDVVVHVEEGSLRTYDVLRALEIGLNKAIPNYHAAIRDRAHVDYWREELGAAERVLRDLNNPDADSICYRGIQLYKR